MAPPFRADHVGSFIRPQALLDAHAARDPSTYGATNLDPATKTAIADVVKVQLDRGITPVTTGEYERWIFYGGFFAQPCFTEIFQPAEEHRAGLPTMRAFTTKGVAGKPMTGRKVPVATEKVRFTKSVYLDDWLYLRSLLPREAWGKAKMTVPAPMFHHIQLKNGAWSPDAYSSDEEYLMDVSRAMRQEILALYDAGLRVVQIDDPNMTFFCDEEFCETQKAEGNDLGALLDLYIKAHNELLRDLPGDLTIGVHLCRGNWPQGVHVATGGYEPIANRMFKDLGYKLFYLEFDSDRAGNFEPLRFLPKDKAVVLGIVTTKFAELESEGTLKARVLEAADVVAKAQGRTREEALAQNLAISPQCGFASVSFGTGVGFSIDRMWEKLALVKKVADDVWGK